MLSIYLESFLKQHQNPKNLFSEQMDRGAPNRLKARYSARLKMLCGRKKNSKGLKMKTTIMKEEESVRIVAAIPCHVCTQQRM
jgi:hypothetical protein